LRCTSFLCNSNGGRSANTVTPIRIRAVLDATFCAVWRRCCLRIISFRAGGLHSAILLPPLPPRLCCHRGCSLSTTPARLRRRILPLYGTTTILRAPFLRRTNMPAWLATYRWRAHSRLLYLCSLRGRWRAGTYHYLPVSPSLLGGWTDMACRVVKNCVGYQHEGRTLCSFYGSVPSPLRHLLPAACLPGVLETIDPSGIAVWRTVPAGMRLRKGRNESATPGRRVQAPRLFLDGTYRGITTTGRAAVCVATCTFADGLRVGAAATLAAAQHCALFRLFGKTRLPAARWRERRRALPTCSLCLQRHAVPSGVPCARLSLLCRHLSSFRQFCNIHRMACRHCLPLCLRHSSDGFSAGSSFYGGRGIHCRLLVLLQRRYYYRMNNALDVLFGQYARCYISGCHLLVVSACGTI